VTPEPLRARLAALITEWRTIQGRLRAEDVATPAERYYVNGQHYTLGRCADEVEAALRAASAREPARRLWRVGRKVGRTIYQQEGDDPADGDVLIGLMDSRELAHAAVDAYNQQIAARAATPEPPQ